MGVRVPGDELEIIRARLLELVPEGFEEIEHAGEVELVAYTDEPGAARLLAAFPGARARPVAEGWEDRWREFHRAVVVGGIWIGPPWEEPPSGVESVVVDPGRAFGTGAHPTTRASVELLARAARGSVLDAGCGSVVVAVAAVRLGHGPVHAVDLDPTAVEVARETCRRNGVDVHVRQADVLGDDLPVADLLVANIELTVVERLLSRRLAVRAVTSGYLTADELSAPGWSRADRIEIDGWAADALERL